MHRKEIKKGGKEKMAYNPNPILLEDEDKVSGYNELWSNGYIVDRLKQHLATVNLREKDVCTKKIFDSRKYYNQAHDYLKAGAFKPVPSLIINLSDFGTDHRLLKELHDLDKESRGYRSYYLIKITNKISFTIEKADHCMILRSM